MTEPYKPKKPKSQGRVWIDRRKPFELFLKTGGIFAFHLEVHRLCVTLDPLNVRRWDKHQPVYFQGRLSWSYFFLRLWHVIVTLDPKV